MPDANYTHLPQVNEGPRARAQHDRMESETQKLHRDLARFQRLLSLVTHPKAIAIVQELTVEAKARLRELEWEEKA
jgi:hypothetical protein